MDFDANYREKFSSQNPLLLHENYSPNKQRDDQFSLEQANFSSKPTNNFLHDLHSIENFNLNGPSSSPNNPMFSIPPPTSFDTFDNSTYQCLPNFDFYETKPYGNNATLAPLLDNFTQSGGIGVLGLSQMMVTPVSMISPSVQGYSPYTSYRDFGLTRSYKAPDEGSCTSPRTDVNSAIQSFSTATMVKRGGRGRKKKTNVVKGQWTIEEDRLLIQLVERYGVRKWSQIAQLLNGRIGKQCRERWHNHLRPDIKKDIWSEEEDRILIKAHAEIGNKWAEIAKKLPGRTENSIKNHWNATKRRQFSRRKCRSKYPRQSSLLQEYIKGLAPETINAGCRKKPIIIQNTNNNNPKPTMIENSTTKSPNDQNGSSDSSSSYRIEANEYEFSDVPDFNFDAQMFEESSIDSLLDCMPNEEVGNGITCYDDELQGQGSCEIVDDPEMDLGEMMHGEVKKELDLVEMINQVNL